MGVKAHREQLKATFWKRFRRCVVRLAKQGGVPHLRILIDPPMPPEELPKLRAVWAKNWPGRRCNLQAGGVEYEIP